MNSEKKGFTLIELLVVIAIIGILSSVVLANLNSARQKARDVARISDIKSIQLALTLYFDNNAYYPKSLASGAGELAPNYIPSIPTPPSGAASYAYVPLNSECNSYHLGAVLELSSNSVLTNDSDAAVGTLATAAKCGGGGTLPSGDFDGTSAACTSTGAKPQPGGAEACYDVTP